MGNAPLTTTPLASAPSPEFLAGYTSPEKGTTTPRALAEAALEDEPMKNEETQENEETEEDLYTEAKATRKINLTTRYIYHTKILLRFPLP